MTMLVVAPISNEFDVLARVFEERWGAPKQRDAGRIPVREFGAANVILAEGGFGKVQFGVATQHLLDHLSDVDLVVCAGIAGGLAESLGVGDVVVGKATVEHDFHSVLFKDEPPRFDGSGEHVEALAGEFGDGQRPFQVLFGPIASGDEAIVEPERRAEVRARSEGLAVAYEGAGGARAATFSGIPYIEVRGISDMADHDFLEELETVLPIAMVNVATVVAWLAEHPVAAGTP
ncbi:MAG: 5'-methylthioadenosine/S-adenosylhomocysteine nucleosidase [Dehalococcoidia bacterium]|nr:5'-methylthioadenosine/S-adenosylhomocysteine nucleosidase [Dehalococcoidia bacterium]